MVMRLQVDIRTYGKVGIRTSNYVKDAYGDFVVQRTAQ